MSINISVPGPDDGFLPVKKAGKDHTMALGGLHGKMGQSALLSPSHADKALARKEYPETSLRDLHKLQGPFLALSFLKGNYNWRMRLSSSGQHLLRTPRATHSWKWS